MAIVASNETTLGNTPNFLTVSKYNGNPDNEEKSPN